MFVKVVQHRLAYDVLLQLLTGPFLMRHSWRFEPPAAYLYLIHITCAWTMLSPSATLFVVLVDIFVSYVALHIFIVIFNSRKVHFVFSI